MLLISCGWIFNHNQPRFMMMPVSFSCVPQLSLTFSLSSVSVCLLCFPDGAVPHLSMTDSPDCTCHQLTPCTAVTHLLIRSSVDSVTVLTVSHVYSPDCICYVTNVALCCNSGELLQHYSWFSIRFIVCE